MDNLFMIREKVRELYASHSKIFDKAIQFVVAFLTFYTVSYTHLTLPTKA